MGKGFESMGLAIGDAISGRTRRRAYEDETKNLANVDYLQAGVRNRDADAEQSLAQAIREKALAAKAGEETAVIKAANDMHADVNNYVPMLAARTGLPADIVQRFVQSQHVGNPHLPPQIEPDKRNQLGEMFSQLLGLKLANKGVGGEDIPKVFDSSLRNASGQTAMAVAATDPTKAAWNLNFANNKDEPKLYAANGDNGIFSTLTGLPVAGTGAPKGGKAPTGYRYLADGVTLEAIPGGPAQAVADERNYRRDDIALRRAQAAQEKVDRETARKSGELDKKVTRFSGEMGKTGIPETTTLLGAVEARMAKFKDKDIPGYGVIAGGLPDIFISDEGKALRQEIIKLFNIELKNRSGGAVTSQELDRLKNEFGSGTWKTEDQIRRGLAAYRREFDALRQNVLAGVDTDVLDEYEARGGAPLPRDNRKPPKTPPGTSPTSGYGGHSEEEIQASMQKYGKSREEIIRAIDNKKAKGSRT